MLPFIEESQFSLAGHLTHGPLASLQPLLGSGTVGGRVQAWDGPFCHFFSDLEGGSVSRTLPLGT